MAPDLFPVILCGGTGTRLWPLSRASYPKQFGQILGETSLFQQTIARFPPGMCAAPVIVTGADFRFVVTEQLSDIERTADRILIEPQAANTAPAVLAAALSVARDVSDALLLVCPSDHVITDAETFRTAVAAALPAARAGQLVTFGVLPTRPATGYGYLELEAGLPDTTVAAPLPLRRFVEKPDAVAATEMLATGRYLWNSGIFMFSAQAIIAAFATHQPALTRAVRAAVAGAGHDLSFLRLDPEAWAGAETISIDYAIMEKVENLAVMPLHGGWSDLGAWDEIAREMGPDAQGVALSGPARAIDCEASLLRAESPDQTLIGVGLKNIAAIAMRDAVLVADLRDSQRVREAVALLRADGAPQATEFPRVHRPWGWYETLSFGRHFQVKRIMVHPGGILSLQSHVHRSEHWVVVEGTAQVTLGTRTRLLGENQSIYIPLGAVHRLKNPGNADLHLIEVQSGHYLGEDDIIRHEDAYARV